VATKKYRPYNHSHGKSKFYHYHKKNAKCKHCKKMPSVREDITKGIVESKRNLKFGKPKKGFFRRTKLILLKPKKSHNFCNCFIFTSIK